MLRARRITVRQGGKAALQGVDFTARPGEVTAIIGPSGAGKSTLLKALTGDLAFSGEVRLNGEDIAAATLSDLARIRAVLPQASPMAFPFTAIEVVRLGLVSHPGRDLIAQQALARVGLAGFEPRLYQELSGGEQQRLHLARVLTQVWEPVAPNGAPRWLFLDEPVSSLDIGHQLRVMQILRDFACRGGGVVMVMHDLNLTAMGADRVALLKDGRIMVQSDPGGVFQASLLGDAYGCSLQVNRAPERGAFVLPQMATPNP